MEISILEFIHSESIIHRDLKLENLVMGIDSAFFQLHLIDFGLSKRFVDPQTDKHILMKSGKTLLGSVEYASINNHNAKEISRRDDMEACAYILIHLLLGELPWSHLCGEDKAQENEARICSLKQKIGDNEKVKKLPVEFMIFLESIKKLGFEDQPKYTDYRRMFKELMIREGNSFDYIYDWILIPVSSQIAKEMNDLDELYEMEDKLTKEEEDEIAALMMKYEQDPTVIDYRLEEIKRQNKKFDVVSPNNSPKNSMEKDPKSKEDKKSKNKSSTDASKGSKNKKDKDCTLI